MSYLYVPEGAAAAYGTVPQITAGSLCQKTSINGTAHGAAVFDYGDWQYGDAVGQ